jgi:hypothetical protein
MAGTARARCGCAYLTRHGQEKLGVDKIGM